MISERIAVRAFESVWSTCIPMLTPAFINSFNQQFVKPIVCAGKPLRPVPASYTSDSPSLVAELGIQIVRSAVEAQKSVEDIAKDQTSVGAAWSRSLELINRYEGEKPDIITLPLNSDDASDALGLARNLSSFLDQFDGDAEFSPLIPGSNKLSRCEADLAVAKNLIEIKTASRRFRTVDLRQLLLYLALDWVGGEPRWTRGCLVNPRRAEWADFDVDWLMRRLTGRPAADVFRDLIDAFNSDFELETNFF